MSPVSPLPIIPIFKNHSLTTSFPEHTATGEGETYDGSPEVVHDRGTPLSTPCLHLWSTDAAIDPAATLLSLPYQSSGELGGYQHPHSALSTHSSSSNACSSLPPSPSPATPQTIVPASLQHENTSPHAPYLHTYYGTGSSLDDGFTLAEAYPLLPLYVSDDFTVDYPNDIFDFNWGEASKDLHDPEPLLPIPPLTDTRSPSPIQSSLWSSRHCSTSTRTHRYSPYARAVTRAAPSREICSRSNDITAALGAGIASDSLDYQQSTSAPNFCPPIGETEVAIYVKSEQIQNHEDQSSGFAPVERKINDNPHTATARKSSERRPLGRGTGDDSMSVPDLGLSRREGGGGRGRGRRNDLDVARSRGKAGRGQGRKNELPESHQVAQSSGQPTAGPSTGRKGRQGQRNDLPTIKKPLRRVGQGYRTDRVLDMASRRDPESKMAMDARVSDHFLFSGQNPILR
ncbi:hypothetical protein CVT25_008169 [Psilocybe cyanescens]|uniref:Uncharacterized protein n=1 Tax=Psilocybe cyanescens TaxID=93625 RepID=A0A409XGB1_PSICY|nr:hypothetical protein CVT25_008169 [Psilocybe cyanescens]